MAHLFLLVDDVADNIGQILTLKAHSIDSLFLECQSHLNIFDHHGCGRSCERQYRSIGQLFADIDDSQIRRTEVIAPLADTMSLIYADEAYLHVAYLLDEDVCRNALRRDVKQFHTAKDGILQRLYNLVA